MSTVKEQLVDLFSIQRIDQAIFEAQRGEGDLPKLIEDLHTEIANLQAELTGVEGQVAECEAEITKLESNGHAESDRIKKWERRLQEIRNQREYLALSREIEGARRGQRRAEESIIELMNQRDEFQAKVEELTTAVLEKEEALAGSMKELDARKADIQETVGAYEKNRDELVPKIKAPLLKKYDHIRSRRQQVGLVVAKEGKCEGCNMRLPPQLYNTLMRNDSIEQCPSCQRLLVFHQLVEKDVEQVAAPAVIEPR